MSHAFISDYEEDRTLQVSVSGDLVFLEVHDEGKKIAEVAVPAVELIHTMSAQRHGEDVIRAQRDRT